MSKGIKAFITYAHSDSRQKFELQKRLAVMKQKGEIAAWDDNQILASDEWEKEIATHLADSDILLYLVSANSLASKNCNKELIEALKDTNTKTIPIILENCDWKAHEISNFEVLPDKGKAINKWSPRADGWRNVVESIEKTVQAIQKVETEPPANEQEKGEIDALLLFQQANFLFSLGQFDQAIQLYSKIINRDPNFDGAYNNRGNAYKDKGEYDKAIADYNMAISLKPDYAEAYNNRGEAYNTRGEYDKAIADYDKAITLNPYNALAHCNRGEACLYMQLWEQARKDLQTARDRGMDIIDSFNIDYKNVADFESKTGITLPADIAEMLTRKIEEGKS